eukprot:TRINITY_DN4903_c0_g1_i3.p1 TRINITY_DN4903_c0_g1~~TRINITY_DN4903_c0_g1_i3.p1  ORF type:complete len:234 (+),score=22.95 TRINITY_DN4903_c0_g1_i3:76-777(+)
MLARLLKKTPNKRYCSTQTHNKNPIVLKHTILEQALTHVKVHGWTHNAIAMAAKDLGYSSIFHGIAPNGNYDLVAHYIDKGNKDMSLKLETSDLTKMTNKQKIKFALETRLRFNLPLLSRWPEAMAIMSQPLNLPSALHKLSIMADEIWYRAGDSSLNIDWYVKRGVVIGIYTSTELYLLTDMSKDKRDTWEFLDNRLDDYILMSKVKTDAESTLSALSNACLLYTSPSPRDS